MAPVGRWQKNKDLSWYAKNDDSPAALSAAEARKEEIRKIKEAEQDALSKALGYEPVDRSGINANTTPLGQKEVEKAIKETAEGDEEAEAKGVGFGVFLGAGGPAGEDRDTLRGVGLDRAGGQAPERREEGDGKRRERRRSRSRDRSRDRRRRRHTYDDGVSHRRHKSRHTSRHRARYGSGNRHDTHAYSRERSRSHERRRDDDLPPRRPRERSYSPDPHQRRRHSRHRNHGYKR